MITLATNLSVSSTRESGFVWVALFGLVGLVASLMLAQQGVDISPAMF
ncbi:hypothetical protein [Bradyrhizobium sp. HKCCYLS20291]